MRFLMKAVAALVAFLALPAAAFAQVGQCRIPDIKPGRAIFPPPGNAVIAPITGHLLALSWSPQFCKVNGKEKEYASQCGDQKFGFILHGLWADGEGRNNPVWCKKMPAVPVEVMKKSFCAMPSPVLMQHEWAKHGSCVAGDAETYFRTATMLFDALKWPDMEALSRYSLDVGELTKALAAANPGLRPDMFSVDVTPLGWLEEVKLCLDKSYHPRTCPTDVDGAGDRTKLRIWPVR